jgi:hypothetical protein
MILFRGQGILKPGQRDRPYEARSFSTGLSVPTGPEVRKRATRFSTYVG